MSREVGGVVVGVGRGLVDEVSSLDLLRLTWRCAVALVDISEVRIGFWIAVSGNGVMVKGEKTGAVVDGVEDGPSDNEGGAVEVVVFTRSLTSSSAAVVHFIRIKGCLQGLQYQHKLKSDGSSERP